MREGKKSVKKRERKWRIGKEIRQKEMPEKESSCRSSSNLVEEDHEEDSQT